MHLVTNSKQITESWFQVKKVLQLNCLLAHFQHVLLLVLEVYEFIAHISVI
jgi:hypothetical protein